MAHVTPMSSTGVCLCEHRACSVAPELRHVLLRVQVLPHAAPTVDTAVACKWAVPHHGTSKQNRHRHRHCAHGFGAPSHRVPSVSTTAAAACTCAWVWLTSSSWHGNTPLAPTRPGHGTTRAGWCNGHQLHAQAAVHAEGHAAHGWINRPKAPSDNQRQPAAASDSHRHQRWPAILAARTAPTTPATLR